MTNEEYWFWLCRIRGIYSKDIKKILEIYESPKELYEDRFISSELSLTPDQINSIEESRKNDKFLGQLERIKEDGVRFIYMEDKDYPDKFREIPDPPYSFYLKGNLPAEGFPCIGMVGARACSGYGREMADKIAFSLASHGIQVVSGLAVGIDSISARGALKGGGKTFAVLGSGIDVIYPRENIDLYYQIIINGGGIISEYPMGTQPFGWQFPHRNRLISALSDKLVVIEAGKHSGTLSTAMHALDQGKDIYAMPGRVVDRLSEGCNQLIADGAGILLNAEYIIEDLKTEERWSRLRDLKEEKQKAASDTDRSGILKYIGFEPVNASYIMEKSGYSPEQVGKFLGELELDGAITQLSGGYYVVNL